MRNLVVAVLGVSLFGCAEQPGVASDPPVLVIASPARAQRLDHAGAIAVTGKVTPNEASNAPIQSVVVNGVPAVVGADGAFTAVIDSEPGFTSIHTVATDAHGGVAEDTRALLAGDWRAPGATIGQAVTAAISADAFAKIATAAGPMVEGMDLGAMVAPRLGGPQQLALLGHTVDVQVAPSAIAFDVTGGVIALDTSMRIAGTSKSAGYVFTDNGTPAMNPGHGFQLGLADDLMNDALSQVTALGVLDLAQPAPGGTFDTTAIAMTLPPTVSADPEDGTMRLMIGDATVTFEQGGVAVGQAALNAEIDMKVAPVNNGYGVGVQLGKPVIHVTVDESKIANATRMEPADLGKMAEIVLEQQIASMSVLLGGIPLPNLAGLQMHDLTVASETGYVMVKGDLQ